MMGGIEDNLVKKGCFSKHESIRIKEWIGKLSWKQSNPVWKKNVNFHLKVLAEMVARGKLGEPFNILPGDGPLRKLSLYDLPFPLREKFSQSKDRSQSKAAMDNSSLSQKFNGKGMTKTKEKILRGIGDYSQSSVFDSKKVSKGSEDRNQRPKVSQYGEE